jgi:pimeloyl-ACP methyl ester carboxylesterase
MTAATVATGSSTRGWLSQVINGSGAVAKPFRFFSDQTYHFQTLRALNDIPFGGADISEVLETVKHIKPGDFDSWYAAWERTGDRVIELASRTSDRISRGRALLRAHNYFRTAEFLLAPNDPRRRISWKKNIRAFYDGLDKLGVSYERIRAAYGEHHLNALYFPGPEGSETRPLVVICGGFDSTLEELYFVVVAAALERGYSVLAYEGPGQGSIIREQGLPFTHEWEKPTAAVLDEYLHAHPRHPSMVLIGMSMGGYLAPRAAAFDDRFDGVVAYDVFYDFGAVSSRSVPPLAIWLERHGYQALLSLLIKLKAASSPYLKWALENSKWVMGTRDAIDTLRALRAYTLENVAERITGDVLILAGGEDHFVPVEQVGQFEASLTRARSVATVVYDRESGGAEHCQLGASSLWHATFFDWLAERFPAGRPRIGLTRSPK